MTRADENKLDVLLHRWLRRILKINWTLHVTNDEVRRRAGVTETLSETVRRRRWTFIGHTLRRGSDDLARTALTWTPDGKRKRGRPKETYRRTVAPLRTLQKTDLPGEISLLARRSTGVSAHKFTM